MIFSEYVKRKTGEIVNLYVKGMSEFIEAHGGRMCLTGRVYGFDDFCEIMTAKGDTTAVRYEDIISLDWSEEDQGEFSDNPWDQFE